MSCCISACVVDNDGVTFTAIVDIETSTTTYINMNTGLVDTPAVPVIACDSVASAGFRSNLYVTDDADGSYQAGEVLKITHADGGGVNTEQVIEGEFINSGTAGADVVRILGQYVSPYRTSMSCSNGVMQIVTTNIGTGGTQTQQAFPILRTADVNDGGVSSFFGNNALNATRSYSSISFTLPGNSNCTHDVLVTGFYEVRSKIGTAPPATMNTQMQVRLDGAGTWFDASGNTAHWGDIASFGGTEGSIPISRRFFPVAAGAHTLDFRLNLTNVSGTVATDELVLTQSRRTVTWTEMCCNTSVVGDF